MNKLNKAFEIMADFDDPTNKVIAEDMQLARNMIWIDGLDKALPRLRNSIHPFHSNVREAIRQVVYMVDVAA